MRISGYSKVFAIGHPKISDIFDGEVTVQEKVDGSQFSFQRVDGKMLYRSRGSDQTEGTDQMFLLGIDEVEKVKDDLVDGWVYRGEYLNKPKHNTLCYERTPKKNIAIFDIDKCGQTDYLSSDEVAIEAERLGFEVVPTLFTGSIKTADEFKELLKIDSFLGGCPIEGVVVKNYKRWTDDGKTMMGKYVSENFKEKHSKDWKDRNPSGKDYISMLITEYGSEARWLKCEQHLKERGELLGEPKDIAGLFKELRQDFETECWEEIAVKLWNHFKKDIIKGVGRGLPEWYKAKLMEGTFAEEIVND